MVVAPTASKNVPYNGPGAAPAGPAADSRPTPAATPTATERKGLREFNAANPPDDGPRTADHATQLTASTHGKHTTRSPSPPPNIDRTSSRSRCFGRLPMRQTRRTRLRRG